MKWQGVQDGMYWFMSVSTLSPDQAGNFVGFRPIPSLGETDENPVAAGKVRPSTRHARQMDAPETERFVFLLKEVLVKKGISQRELSRRLGIKIGTLTRYLKGDVNPYDVKLGIQRALTEELGITMAALYSKLDGTEAPSEITVRDVSSWIKSNATPEDMATLFQSQQEAQFRHLDSMRTQASPESTDPRWIDIDEERAVVISEMEALFFEIVAKKKGLSKREAWTQLEQHLAASLDSEDVELMREVVFGMSTWSVEKVKATILKTWPEKCRTQLAFQNWGDVGALENVALLSNNEIKEMMGSLEGTIAAV